MNRVSALSAAVLALAWCVVPSPALAQERLPGSYAQSSAMMRDMRSFSAGTVEGSFYNEHPAKGIRIAEVTITSSEGTRVFNFVCTLGPRETKEFILHTGLRLDFQAVTKGWWNIAVTRASWAAAPEPQQRCPDK